MDLRMAQGEVFYAFFALPSWVPNILQAHNLVEGHIQSSWSLYCAAMLLLVVIDVLICFRHTYHLSIHFIVCVDGHLVQGSTFHLCHSPPSVMLEGVRLLRPPVPHRLWNISYGNCGTSICEEAVVYPTTPWFFWSRVLCEQCDSVVSSVVLICVNFVFCWIMDSTWKNIP